MDEAQQLIISAYEKARSTGKHDWNKMTTAVLKNRLLDLTDGAFDEATYGVTNFTEFVLRNLDLLRLDRSAIPPIVELRETTQLSPPFTAPIEIASRYRIRADLWRAALDYSSGIRYVWDTVSRRAIQAEEADNRVIIDPATVEVQRDWRKQFRADVTESLSKEESVAVDVWIDQHLGNSQLPNRLKSQWNGYFCDKVRYHLLRWFAESKTHPPDDLALSITGEPLNTEAETEALRKLVLSVVQMMNREELAGLALPSQAVLRTTSSSRS